MNVVLFSACLLLLVIQLKATPFGLLFPQYGDNGNGNGNGNPLNYTPVANFITAIRQDTTDATYPFIERMRQSMKTIAQGLLNVGLQMSLMASQVANNKLNHIAQVVNSFKSPYDTGVSSTTPKPTVTTLRSNMTNSSNATTAKP